MKLGFLILFLILLVLSLIVVLIYLLVHPEKLRNGTFDGWYIIGFLFGGLVGILVVYLIKKYYIPFLDAHNKDLSPQEKSKANKIGSKAK